MSTSKYYVDLFHLSTALSTLSDRNDRDAEIYLWEKQKYDFDPLRAFGAYTKKQNDLWNQNVRFRRCKYSKGKIFAWHTKIIVKMSSAADAIEIHMHSLESISVEHSNESISLRGENWLEHATFIKYPVNLDAINKKQKRTVFTNVSANGDFSLPERSVFDVELLLSAKPKPKCQM